MTCSIEGIDRKFTIHAESRSSMEVYTEKNSVLFLARDPALPATLEAYRLECIRLECDERQIDSLRSLIRRVEAFQAEHGIKLADVQPGEEFERLIGERLDKEEG